MPRSLVGTRSQSSAVLGLVLGACGCNFLGYGALLAGQAGSLGGCGAESAQESSDEGVNNYCAGERAGATWATVGGCALCLGGVYLLLYAACVKKKRPRVAQMDADELEDCLEELDVLRTAVSHAWERCATLEDELHVQSSRSKRESEQALRIKGLEAEIGSLREGVRELGGATVGGFFSSSSAKSAAGTRGLELPADKAGKGGLGGMVTNPLALAKMVGGGGGGRRGTGDLERQLAILTESKASLRRDLVTSNTKVEQLERHASLIAAYQKSAEELNGSLEITLKKAFPDGSPSQPRLHQELEKFKSSVYRDNQYDAQFVELVYEKFLVQKMMGLLDELQKQHALSSLELTRQERMYGELLNRIPKLIAASSGAAASGSGEGPGGGPAAHPDGKQNQQDKTVRARINKMLRRDPGSVAAPQRVAEGTRIGGGEGVTSSPYTFDSTKPSGLKFPKDGSLVIEKASGQAHKLGLVKKMKAETFDGQPLVNSFDLEKKYDEAKTKGIMKPVIVFGKADGGAAVAETTKGAPEEKG